MEKKPRIFAMSFGSVYPLYVQKAEKKGRTKEEVDEVKKTRDPIDHVRERLQKEGWADEAALKAIDDEVKKIVVEAAEYARTSPEPDPKELMTDIYVEAVA